MKSKNPCISATVSTALGRLGPRLAELAEKYNFPPMRAHALLVSAWACAFGTQIGPGLAIMEAEYPRATAIGPLYRYYAAILADIRQQARTVFDQDIKTYETRNPGLPPTCDARLAKKVRKR